MAAAVAVRCSAALPEEAWHLVQHLAGKLDAASSEAAGPIVAASFAAAVAASAPASGVAAAGKSGLVAAVAVEAAISASATAAS